MMNKKRKQMIVQFLNQEMNSAKSVILLDYKGIDVENIHQFRRYCRKYDVQFKVIKNTLFQRAIKETDFQCLDEFIDGPTSILYSKEDSVSPAKAISTYDKKINKFKIKIGSLNGGVLSAEQITELSKLPTKDVLTSQLLGVLNGPARSFVSVLNQTIGGFVNIMNNIKEKKEKENN